jgi:hypothetical protein
MFLTEDQPRKRLAFKSRFIAPILNGTKTQTARTSLKGIQPHELIDAVSDGEVFTPLFITKVEKRKLGTFDDDDFLREGCINREDFENVWKQIHPRKGFNPDTEVYVFHFSIEWAEIS